jgi:transcription-repair coupling factor (superfamily II helicase)
LQLSLSGIRSLSVIETPPLERKPVETALVERDAGFLRGVLARELEREGQVFWVHNRVQGLERVAEYIKNLAPDARVGMAHGQMPEAALERVMHEFWHGEIDILACTAIVESGLDFPRANTMIIDQAQMFGLGQLYQLRGRVGRSPRQAYAYFLVPSIENIPETSRKRLRVIMDMDYLGAGFRVAMEDLRLRGAGNILGEVQSGNIAGIGLDLFLEMLDEEVRRLKGEKIRERTDPELSLGVPARIPERYVVDAAQRLKLYKALSSAHDERAMVELSAEIRDRFGPLPEELANFIAILSAKQILSRLQATRAEIFPGRIVASWEGETEIVPERMVAWIQERKNARMIPPCKLELRLDAEKTFPEALRRAGEELAGLLDDEKSS